jgi:hypothetical protein
MHAAATAPTQTIEQVPLIVPPQPDPQQLATTVFIEAVTELAARGEKAAALVHANDFRLPIATAQVIVSGATAMLVALQSAGQQVKDMRQMLAAIDRDEAERTRVRAREQGRTAAWRSTRPKWQQRLIRLADWIIDTYATPPLP